MTWTWSQSLRSISWHGACCSACWGPCCRHRGFRIVQFFVLFRLSLDFLVRPLSNLCFMDPLRHLRWP